MNIIILIQRWLAPKRQPRFKWLYDCFPRWPRVTRDEQAEAEEIAKELYV